MENINCFKHHGSWRTPNINDMECSVIALISKGKKFYLVTNAPTECENDIVLMDDMLSIPLSAKDAYTWALTHLSTDIAKNLKEELCLNP